MTRDEALSHLREFRQRRVDRAAKLRSDAQTMRAALAEATDSFRIETCERFANHADTLAALAERDAEAMGVLLDG